MKNNVGWLSAIFAVLLMCVFGGVGLYAYRQRLGISLTAPTQVVLVTNTPRASIAALKATEMPPTEIPQEKAAVVAADASQMVATQTPITQIALTPIPEAQQSIGCGETGVWNILVLGSDLNDIGEKRGSDLTRILRADFQSNRVTIYAFPRDLWVDTTGLGLVNPTVNATRLGMVFYEGRLRSPQFGEPEIMLDGIRVSAQALLKNFSAPSDHYLALDLNQLPAIVDSMGGIPINIPATTTDPWIGMVIQAGQQTLNGAQAAAYARAIPDSDFGRIARNQLLLEAMRQKLLDPGVLANIPSLYSKFSAVIVTDFSPEQIQHLVCLLKNVPSQSIIQETVQPAWTHPGPNSSLLWDQSSVLTRLKELGLAK